MATTVGQIQYDVRLNLNQLKGDTKQAEKIVEKSNSTIETSANESGSKVSALLGKITSAAKVASAAMGAALIAGTTFAIKSAASFEQTRVGLENMLGSADAARQMLQKVSKFAADTPFEFPELADTVRQLVAFGFTGEDAYKTMQSLGDVSAAIGAPMGDLAYLMGTLKTQGRAFTIDIRQFAQRGIPIYEYLGQVMNKTTAEVMKLIEEGKVGFPEVEKAFAAMTGEGGKFYQTMDKQSKTLNGRISTLKDIIGQTARQVVGLSDTGDVIQGGLFDTFTNGIKVITKLLENNVEQIKQFSTSLVYLFVGALKIAVNTANAFINILKPMISWVDKNRTIVMGLVTALSALYAAMKIRAGFIAIDAALAALRMSFVVQTIATVGLNGAITVLMTSFKAFLISIGPVGWALGLVTIAAGLLGMAWGRNSQESDRLKAAQDRLKTATDSLKESKDRLRESSLGVEGAEIRLERAQINAKKATEEYGAESLEAREASLELKRAVLELEQAHNNAKDATINHKKAEEEYSRSGGLIESAESKIRAMQGLADILGRTVTQGPINVSPNPVGQRSITGGFNTGADVLRSLSGNANGTEHWKGGPTWVGERGPEIVNLPRGSEVVPNYKAGGSSVNITLNMDGVMARSRADLRDIAKDMIRAVNEELRAKGKMELAI
jgi:hypothetical protein